MKNKTFIAVMLCVCIVATLSFLSSTELKVNNGAGEKVASLDENGLITGINLQISGTINTTLLNTTYVNATGDICLSDGTCLSLVGVNDGSLNSTSWNRTEGYVFLANPNDKVGIGTSTPSVELHIEKATSPSVLIGDSSSSNTGDGAFVLGYAVDNAGDYNLVVGDDVDAGDGDYNLISGYQNTIYNSASRSVVTGRLSKVYANDGVAMGYSVQAGNSADDTTAIGLGHTITLTRKNTFAAGRGHSITNWYSSSLGGYDADISGAFSTAINGYQTISGSNSVGIALDTTKPTLSQSNTLAIWGGKVGVGVMSPSKTLEVSGTLQATDYYSGDGSQGITDSSSYWLCTNVACSSTCQVTIKDGLITGCA